MSDTPSLTSASDLEFVEEGLKRGIFTRTRRTLVGGMYHAEINALLRSGARFVGPSGSTLLLGAEVFFLVYEEPDDPRESLGYTRR